MRAWGMCAVPGPGPGGGRRVAPDLPLQLTWLVFTPGSCPRFFHFLKPQTRSTFIIKTQNQKAACSSQLFSPAWEAAGLGPARPHAAPGSLRSVPAALCAPLPPLKTGRAFPGTSRCHGEKGPGSRKAKRGPSGFMVLPCAPCWGPGPQEPRSSGGAPGLDTSRMRSASGCTRPPQNSDPTGAAQLPGSQSAEVGCYSAWF